MTFRRKSESALAWHRWVAAHRDELVRAGNPDWLYLDETRFANFLDEGGWDPATDFKVEMLDRQQATTLESLITRELPGECLGAVIRSFRRILDSAPGA